MLGLRILFLFFFLNQGFIETYKSDYFSLSFSNPKSRLQICHRQGPDSFKASPHHPWDQESWVQPALCQHLTRAVQSQLTPSWSRARGLRAGQLHVVGTLWV